MSMADDLGLLLKSVISRKARHRLARRLEERRAGMGKLIMTLVVKNEAAIVEQNIRFHCAQGCDGFIVSAHNCTDGTNEILERLRAEGLVLEILYRTSAAHQLNVWVSEMVKLATRKYGAKWMINADADEFYYSKSCDLKKSIVDSAKGGANVLWVDSLFLFPDDRPDFLNCPYFIVNPFTVSRARHLGIAEDPLYRSFIGSQGCTKVIHRTSGHPKPQKGNHIIDIDHQVSIECADIKLFHYHVRNYAGFLAKVNRWREAAKLKPAGEGEHLKRMIALADAGKLRDTYEEQYGEKMRRFLMENGVVARDFSVSDYLQDHGIQA